MLYTAVIVYLIRDIPFMEVLGNTLGVPPSVLTLYEAAQMQIFFFFLSFFYDIYFYYVILAVLILLEIPDLNVYLLRIVGYLMLILSLSVALYLGHGGDLLYQRVYRGSQILIASLLFSCFWYLRWVAIQTKRDSAKGMSDTNLEVD